MVVNNLKPWGRIPPGHEEAPFPAKMPDAPRPADAFKWVFPESSASAGSGGGVWGRLCGWACVHVCL